MATSPSVSVPIPGPGILMFSVGVFAAWLFATGRLDAVRSAIVSGSAASTSTTTPVTPQSAAATSTAPTAATQPAAAAGGGFLQAYQALQAGGLTGLTIAPSAGGLTANVGGGS